FNDTATTEIYTLSLHDALPISLCRLGWIATGLRCVERIVEKRTRALGIAADDRRTRISTGDHPQRALHRARGRPGDVCSTTALRFPTGARARTRSGTRPFHRTHAGRNESGLPHHRDRD